MNYMFPKSHSFEPDLNQRPKDLCDQSAWYNHYSPPLYQLSYRRVPTKHDYLWLTIYQRYCCNLRTDIQNEHGLVKYLYIALHVDKIISHS